MSSGTCKRLRERQVGDGDPGLCEEAVLVGAQASPWGRGSPKRTRAVGPQSPSGLSWASLGAPAPHHLLQVGGTGRPRPASARAPRCGGQTVRARRAKPPSPLRTGPLPLWRGDSYSSGTGTPAHVLLLVKRQSSGAQRLAHPYRSSAWAAPATPASAS